MLDTEKAPVILQGANRGSFYAGSPAKLGLADNEAPQAAFAHPVLVPGSHFGTDWRLALYTSTHNF